MPYKDTKITAKTRDIFLTETILSIHHDVQSAIDYISEVSGRESTELGKSPAVMGIEKVRIRLPIIFETEQKEHKVDEKPAVFDIKTIVGNLARRKGFLIDKGAPGKRGLYTKVKLIHPKAAETAGAGEEGPPKQQLVGEIEIIFAPLGREESE
ncbi:MAG: hypothetical protein PHT49_05140 [Desulfovibrionales bacterium]|nr:hypothetical protein [Desulfovibrionales bacterium]